LDAFVPCKKEFFNIFVLKIKSQKFLYILGFFIATYRELVIILLQGEMQ